MAHYSGSALFISFAGTTVSGDHRSLDVQETVNTADTTAGADTHVSHVKTTRAITANATIADLDGAGGSAIRSVLLAGASGTLIFGPEGNSTGDPKFSFLATITEVAKSFPYDKEIAYDVTFTGNGAWTENYDDTGETFA